MTETATTAPSRFLSYDLFGAKITPMNATEMLHAFESHIDNNFQCIMASQNMHGLRVHIENVAVRDLHDLPQTHVHIDGMPLVGLCRLNGIPAGRDHRVTLVDFVWPLLELSAKRGWRVYYLGATEEIITAGQARIAERLPELNLRAHHGYIDNTADADAVNREIADFQPHLVLVGLGMGRQERWILANLATLGTASVMTMGACMEYIAGAVGTPPRWMGRTGLEWFYRFAEQPARFWRRYLIEPWIVLGHIAWYQARKGPRSNT
jgi:N-acetylglucosaminyldiphosphoundecaprenol N-acetyl-beta-D-mannosaminyltransferase